MSGARQRVINLLRGLAQVEHSCPAHGLGQCHHTSHGNRSHDVKFPTSISSTKEYAFEMASSNIRYGRGVTQEVGIDLKNLNASKILVVTDFHVAQLPILSKVLSSCKTHDVAVDIYDGTKVEPTDASLIEAVQFALPHQYNAFVAVGGGSVMDTCKVVNLISSLTPQHGRPAHCEDVTAVTNCLMRFVNAPIGLGEPVSHTLKPLIAIPTTAGTGSETTGVAIFDYLKMKAKTGIAHRNLRPILGLIDPDHTQHQPRSVACYSGFDVFCHALESFTALPYYERTPRPCNPLMRPAYQGSNPISDVWARYTLSICAKYFMRAVQNPDDTEARGAMHLASSCAGMGFGNAGVHLAHAMSYPISGLASTLSYRPPLSDYPWCEKWGANQGFIPHGLSVAINAPAVFKFTAPFCPERHLEAAKLLQPETDFSRVKLEDAGKALTDVILKYMKELGIPDGLQSFGFSAGDIPTLVEGVIPQHRLTKLSPRAVEEEDIYQLFEDTMKIY